ncbi:MAG: flagellar hook-basal body complex protein FliE [Desulfovibrionales bacterium]
MAINPIAMKTYANVAKVGTELAQAEGQGAVAGQEKTSFMETMSQSLAKVNELSSEKARMVDAFASGETQNVHELMISLQRSGMAMSLTSAVRNKVMEAYKELIKMPF